MLWEQGVEGSNPFAPTVENRKRNDWVVPFLVFKHSCLSFCQVNNLRIGSVAHHRGDTVVTSGLVSIHLA